MARYPELPSNNLPSIVGWAGQMTRSLQRSVRDVYGGTVTLEPGETETVVSDQVCSLGSFVVLQPTTASAAAEVGTTFTPIEQVLDGSFTVNHANNTVSDRTFFYIVYEPDGSPV